MRFPVMNVPRRRLGDLWPTSTMGPSIAPAGPGTTGVTPWGLVTENDRLKPQDTSEANVADIYSGKANLQKTAPMPIPPEPYVSDILENPENPDQPLPKFITREEADRAKNLTGLAVTGGALVALVVAGLIAFR